MSSKKILGVSLAAAAALAFAVAPVASFAKTTKVPCMGVNGCKGKGACKSMGVNACKGKNSCKGKGMKMMSAKKCEKMHGTVQAEAPVAAPVAPVAAPVAPAEKPAS